jgi:hypothetical protein
LPKAIVLARSVYAIEHQKLIIFFADQKQELDLSAVPADIRWIEDQGIDDLNHLAFMYDVTEFTTSIKPLLTLKLLQDCDKVIFLDPDICLFGSLRPVYELMERYPIVLTPHYTVPIDSKSDNFDLGMMRFGSFNLGFYAVTGQPEALSFLNWWSERCLNLCFFETQFGLSTDQKWVSIAPCFFPNIHISFHLGLNMAFWNLHERTLTKRTEGYVVNNSEMLVFFHFSSFDASNPKSVSTRPHRWIKSGRPDLDEICCEYAEQLKQNDNGYSFVKYSFDYMSNGSYISPTLRRAYAAIAEEIPKGINPFDAEGVVMDFARKNRLLERNNLPYRPADTSNIQDHKWKIKIVFSFLRFLLRAMGPNSFFNLSRLFVYLSSYRQNRGLWKL